MAAPNQQQQQPPVEAGRFDAFEQYIGQQLRDPAVVGQFVVDSLDKAENAVGVKREHLAYAFIGLYSIYLIFGGFARTACNIVCFAFPCYASFKAIESVDKNDDTQWLTYWCVFGAFSLIDEFAQPIMDVMPLYWLSKCAFMVYLYHPLTVGATMLYIKLLHPFLSFVQGHLEGTNGMPVADVPAQGAPPPNAKEQKKQQKQMEQQRKQEQQAQQQAQQQQQQQQQQPPAQAL